MSVLANTSPLALASEVYARSREACVTRHTAGWPELGQFSIALRKFKASLGDLSAEDYWVSLLAPLRKFAFLLVTTPLPPHSPDVCRPGTADALEEHLRNVHSLSPDHAASARDLVRMFKGLTVITVNPLLGQLERVCTGAGAERMALLLKESRLCEAVEACLSRVRALKEVEVVNPHRLRSDECYDRLIILGAAGWYPEYVFTAPRASEIHLVRPRWIRDTWRPEPTFLSTDDAGHATQTSSTRLDVLPAEGEEMPVDDSIDAGEMLPKVDFDSLLREYTRRHGPEPEQEVVDAALFLLEGGAAVFIDTADRTKILTIDPEGAPAGERQRGASRLKKLLATYVEPGTYILLRTGGSGDYLVQLADKILGDSADKIRQSQVHWKSLLRQAISRKDLFRTSLELIDLGSERADEDNVRNWASSRNISPERKADFDAIMELTGLEDRAAEYWANTRALNKARLKAGVHIRRLLLKQVATADLDELEAAGRMSFELPGGDAGSFTAYRVLSVSGERHKVLASHLGEPFYYEGETWLE